ncbi:MAG: DUF2802 domain-containing protein [Pseudomonadota bacterium]
MSFELMTYPKVLAVVFAALFVATFLTLLTVRQRLSMQDGEMRRLMTLIASHDDESTEPQEREETESLTEALTRLSSRIDAIGLQQASAARSPGLDEAAAMARAGGSANEIANRAGISVGEAELLLRVQANRANAKGVE